MGVNKRPTTADYFVIAVTPALVMVLVGSLVFYLISAFYDGQYEARLKYIAALFVFAAVLISRIMIEHGSEQASLYALALAVVSGFTIKHFTDASLLVIAVVIGVTWWLADRLTWDCTVIDEQDVDPGDGLIGATTSSEMSRTKDRDDPAVPILQPRWKRWFTHRRSQHPGVWVVYSALVTLPLIGLGQFAVPADDIQTRRACFTALVGFVAASLGLLATTSFLTIRRYLRQRQMDMPPAITQAWAIAGGGMIVGVLAVASLLPRPRPAYSLTQWIESRTVARANQNHWIQDGATEQRRDAASVTRQNHQDADSDSGSGSDASSDASSDSHSGSASQPTGESANANSPRDSKSTRNDSSASSKNASSDDSSSKSSGPSSPSADGASSASEHASSDDSRAVKPPAGSDDPTSGDLASPSQPGDDAAANESNGTTSSNASEPNASESNASEPNASEPNASEPNASESVSPSDRDRSSGSSTHQSRSRIRPPNVSMALRWLYRIVVLIVVLVLLIRNASFVAAAIGAFWKDLMSLFAGSARDEVVKSEPEGDSPTDVEATFASFANPFRAGNKLSDHELIQYTFSALEAWSRDAAKPRGQEETPYEFSRRFQKAFPDQGPSASYVIRIYDLLAYRGGSPPIDRERVRQLWQQLEQL